MGYGKSVQKCRAADFTSPSSIELTNEISGNKLQGHRIVLAITKILLLMLNQFCLERCDIVHAQLLGDKKVQEVVALKEDLREALASE